MAFQEKFSKATGDEGGGILRHVGRIGMVRTQDCTEKLLECENIKDLFKNVFVLRSFFL